MTVKHVIAAVVIIVCVSIAGVITLAATGKPTDAVIQFVGVIIGASIPSLFALAQLSYVREDVRQVKQQVNGHMTDLVEKIPDRGQRDNMRAVIREVTATDREA